MSIGKYNNTRDILNKYNISAKKKYGQNFLVDQNILQKIVDGAEIDRDTIVVEIGPGLGSLTEYLCKKAKEGIAYEIESEMVRVLEDTMSDYDNLTIINKDILKDDLKSLEGKEIVVVANLPYYITTPILFKLLESKLNIKRFVLMMQKEVAQRLSGNINTKEYNALSITIQYHLHPRILFNVSREVFIPRPNVDSAVISLERLDPKKVDVDDEKWFFTIVKSSFKQRRKTLANNLNATIGIDKVIINEALIEIGKKENSRAESLTIEDFAKLSKIIKKDD